MARKSDSDGWYDPDAALAENARLTAINADLLKVNLSHAEALARIAELEAEVGRLTGDNHEELRRAPPIHSQPEQALAGAAERLPDTAARIAELEAERDKLANNLRMSMDFTDGLYKTIASIEAERDRLKAALEPFALAADVTDDLAAGIGLDEIMSSLSVGDLRRARAALSGEGVTT